MVTVSGLRTVLSPLTGLWHGGCPDTRGLRPGLRSCARKRAETQSLDAGRSVDPRSLEARATALVVTSAWVSSSALVGTTHSPAEKHALHIPASLQSGQSAIRSVCTLSRLCFEPPPAASDGSPGRKPRGTLRAPHPEPRKGRQKRPIHPRMRLLTATLS